jgi:hypothetical protein
MSLKKGLLLWGMVLLLAMALALGCSDDDEETPTNGTNPPTTTTVDPTGGVLQIAGAVVLGIPPGALTDTVEFTVQQNTSPAALPDGFFASNVYTIGPAGQTFAVPALLSLTFDEAKLGKPFDTSLEIFTNDGTGWSSLSTTLDSAGHMAMATVTHLSDFAVCADTADTPVTPAEGFSAALVVGRLIYDSTFYIDGISAKFDSSLSPCTIVNPQQADSVECNQALLEWWPLGNFYKSPDMYYDFLFPGNDYVFTVYGNAAVPSLVDTITFPSLEPYITYPSNGATVSRLSELVMTWAGSGSGTVGIFMGPSQTGAITDTSFFVEVPNSGSFTINTALMQTFGTGEHGIVLIHQNRKPITATGYNSETSFIAGRMINAINITLQ